MKVRNLLLASLAVAAMTACSNENDEFVNNGNKPVKRMRLWNLVSHFLV